MSHSLPHRLSSAGHHDSRASAASNGHVPPGAQRGPATDAGPRATPSVRDRQLAISKSPMNSAAVTGPVIPLLFPSGLDWVGVRSPSAMKVTVEVSPLTVQLADAITRT